MADRAWSWLRFQGMLHAIVKGDHELSYRRAEAERINAAIRELIPRRMDSNPKADWRIESVIAIFPINLYNSLFGYMHLFLTNIPCVADVASFP